MICEQKKNIETGTTVVDSNGTSKRGTVKMNLSPRAVEFMETLRKRTTIPRESALTRIIEWFVSLDPKLRLSIITGEDDKTRKELLWIALREMVAGGEAGDVLLGSPVEISEATAVIRKLLDQIEIRALSSQKELAALAKRTKKKEG